MVVEMEIKTMETKVKEEKVMEMENINFIFLSKKKEANCVSLFLLLHQILTRC
jgi:hypothetical protein